MNSYQVRIILIVPRLTRCVIALQNLESGSNWTGHRSSGDLVAARQWGGNGNKVGQVRGREGRGVVFQTSHWNFS